mgnify:CR=1 FL=1
MHKDIILVVDDDENLTYIVKDALQHEGYEVCTADNGVAGIQLVSLKHPDLVIADVMMPGMDGFSMIESIRRIGYNMPVLMLTARTDTEDLLQGYDKGANDYVRKPFVLAELMARVRAHLRFRKMDNTNMKYSVGDCVLDIKRNKLTIGDKEAILTYTETIVLSELMSHPGCIIESRNISSLIWGSSDYSHVNRLHGFIHKIRRHLLQSASIDILNIRGVGYKLVIDENKQSGSEEAHQ